MFTLTHTLYAVDTYTAQATVGDVNKGLTNHKVGFPYSPSVKISLIFSLTQNLESSDTALLVFGNGDGGGGPLAKMLENVRLLVPSLCQSHQQPFSFVGFEQ